MKDLNQGSTRFRVYWSNRKFFQVRYSHNFIYLFIIIIVVVVGWPFDSNKPYMSRLNEGQRLMMT